MSAILRLEWRRFPKGVELQEREPTPSHPGPSLWVVARGGRRGHKADPDPMAYWGNGLERRAGYPPWERYVLEGTDNGVFLELANTPLTPEGVLAFVDRWGMLDCGASGRPETELPLERFYHEIRTMKEAAGHILMRKASSSWIDRIMRVNVELCRSFSLGDTSPPRTFLKVKTLSDFCWAEVLQRLDGKGFEIRKCPRCGNFFALGSIGQQRVHCSDKCRVAMHRKTRKAKREREERASNVVRLRDSGSR